MTVLSTQSELKQNYQGEALARRYVQDRFACELTRLLHERQVAAIQRLMDQLQPRLTLEIAPGPGRLTRDVRAPGTLVCLEYNEGMIHEGQVVCDPGVRWVRGDAFALPLGPGFDLVYTLRFIRHFHRPDRDRLYAEIRRVLKPGGVFLMDAVNEKISAPLRRAHPDEYRVHDELYRPEELQAELTEAGFQVQELLPVQKWYSWQYRSQVLIGPRWNWLNRLVVRTLERLPGRDGLEWIVTCRRV